jgi:hypothetical protein
MTAEDDRDELAELTGEDEAEVDGPASAER